MQTHTYIYTDRHTGNGMYRKGNSRMIIPTYKYVYPFVSPCVGGSIVPPCTLYCMKYQLAGVYLSAKPHRLTSIHSHQKLHSGDTNYIKHAQILYVYAIEPSGLVLYSVYVPIGHTLSNTYYMLLYICTSSFICSCSLLMSFFTLVSSASNTCCSSAISYT